MAIVSKYSLNGNTNDSAGSNNGTPTNVSYAAGKSGEAGSFNNSRILSSATTGLTANTVLYLIKITTNPTTGNRYVLHWLRDDINAGIGRNLSKFYYVNTGGTLSINQSNSSDGSYTAINNFNLGDGKWHNIVFVLETLGGTQKTYVDGIQLTNTGIQGTSLSGITTPALFSIGSNTDFSNPLNGIIDEIEIHNTALTPAEIKNKDLYYNGFI